ncbi:hypothetical protein RHGRI_011932 [Rhododendron griersonianum]|uniref:Uncharacterized protein n=1 Tax=Rhododendron griersonianum TaxID=479676 RepID=A0AAV6KPS0_9ERIC|nr:hypothetical protein RHGRI_011932 [Rhododendron griersonianum]
MTMGVEEGGDRDDYTEDGTVDLKGNPVRRSKTGGWKACSFVVGTDLYPPHSFSMNLGRLLVLLFFCILSRF